jgi:hypothetical protein
LGPATDPELPARRFLPFAAYLTPAPPPFSAMNSTPADIRGPAEQLACGGDPPYSPRLPNSFERSRDRHDEIDERLSHHGASHCGNDLVHLKEFVQIRGLTMADAAVAKVIQEIGDLYAKEFGQSMQLTNAELIDPRLVFLDLLVANIERRTDFALRHPQSETAHSQFGSDFYVERVWRFH